MATVSSLEQHLAETLSTLKFAQRAKDVRTSAVVNEETSGTMLALQKEVFLLRARLAAATDMNLATLCPGMSMLSPGNSSLFLTPSKRPGDQQVSPRKRSTDLGYNAANAKLLSEALERCQAAEELKLRAELKLRSISLQLEQEDKMSMGLKMKIKMRDSELNRLKGKVQ